MTTCTFRAIIPNLQSAIQVAGDGGWRVKLDIPATDEANALELLTMRGQVLKITVEPEKQVRTGDEQGTIQTRGKRQSEW